MAEENKMADTLQKNRVEHRRSLRIDENLPVKWKIDKTSFHGEGRIKNLSALGLCLETDNPSAMEGNGSFFIFDKFLPDAQLGDSIQGKLVWSQRKGLGQRKAICGLEFVNPQEEVTAKIRERIQKRIVKLTTARKLKSIFYAFLFIAMIVLGAYTIREFNLVSMNWQSSSAQLRETSAIQARLQKETAAQLAEAKETLKETELMLTQAQDENARLQSEIAQLKEQTGQLEAAQSKNEQLNQELSDVKSRLQLYEREINSLEDGRALIATFSQKIRSVKLAMHDLKRQAQEAKIAALKERDRIKMLEGNNGFLLKEGKLKIPASDKANENKRFEIRVEMAK